MDWLTIMQLKALPRAGWLRVGIDKPESVAAHSWGLAMLCMEWAPKSHIQLDLTKVLKLALIHDIPEVITGDITPHDNIPVAHKHTQELQAAKALLPPELFELWQEYLNGNTPEAHFVHQMDKIDMAIQAKVYQNLTNTDEFIDSAYRKLDTEYKQILTTILAHSQ